MRTLLITALLLATPVLAFDKIPPHRVALLTRQMEFRYESDDGQIAYPCRATLTYPNDGYDYTVHCYAGEILKKTLSVHVALTRYEKTEAPRTRIEILYWVNQQGATSWLMFDEPTLMKTFESSQSIVGEPAALLMRVVF